VNEFSRPSRFFAHLHGLYCRAWACPRRSSAQFCPTVAISEHLRKSFAKIAALFRKLKSAISLFPLILADFITCAFLLLFLEIADFIFEPFNFLSPVRLLEPLSLWGKPF
jgi:hypothetical protein